MTQNKLEITEQETTYLSKTVKCKIRLTNGKEITIYKWWKEDIIWDDYDCDWEPANEESQKIIEELTDEENDELSEFVSDIK